jgi:hypothetical protein
LGRGEHSYWKQWIIGDEHADWSKVAFQQRTKIGRDDLCLTDITIPQCSVRMTERAGIAAGAGKRRVDEAVKFECHLTCHATIASSLPKRPIINAHFVSTKQLDRR